MKKLTKLLLACTLAAAMLLPCLPASAMNNNPATDWMGEALYGIDGPSPAVNIPPINPETWSEDIQNFDVQYAVDIAEQAGAGYMLIGATQVDGYLIAPNDRYDELTGRKPGERCSSRDLIEEYYQELSKRGMKLMLYFTGDGPTRSASDMAALGWTGGANETFRKNWFSVAEWWAKKYGNKIAGWWIDGAYPIIGYDSEQVLTEFANALKAGNPNAVVCFSAGQGMDSSWDPRWGVGDFIAGENYGLTPEPEGRWYEGQQWQRYLPLYEYNGAGCAYAVPELVEYMKKVQAAGGCVTLAVGSSGERVMPFDPVQLDVLKALNKALREGIDPPMSFDGSQKIQAGMCTEMMKVGTDNPRLSIMPIICTTGSTGGGIRWQVPDHDQQLFISPNTYTERTNFELWAKYDEVTIPEGAKYLAVSIKEPDTERFGFEHRLEIRLDERTGGEVLGTVDNVGYIDSFQFASEPVTAEPVEGYKLVNIPVDVAGSVRDIFLVNVLRDAAKVFDPYKQIKAIDVSDVPEGQVSILTNTMDYNSETIGNYDNNDTLAYRGVDFGETGAVEFTARLAVDAPFANQQIEIYIDAPNAAEGTLVGTHSVQATGDWEDFTIQSSPIKKVTGVHDVFFVGRGTEGVCNFDWFRFSDNMSVPDYSKEAQKLYDLGVYKGISADAFAPDLGAALDRQTGAVMLLRIFDKEEEALKLTDAECDEILTGFKDKDEIALWAKPHAAYAVKNGIIQGVETDVFGPAQPLLGKAYCTLILRNLGYTVSGDEYNQAAFILSQKGGITESEAKLLNDRELLKNEMVGISYYSLFVKATDGTTPMAVLMGTAVPGGDLSNIDPSKAATEEIIGIEFDSKVVHPEDIPRIYNDNGGYVGNFNGQLWVCYKDIDFGSEGATRFAAKVGCESGYDKQFLEVRLDSPDAAPVATLQIGATGSWTNFQTQVTEMARTTGVHDVYIYGNGSYGICSLHSFQFLK